MTPASASDEGFRLLPLMEESEGELVCAGITCVELPAPPWAMPPLSPLDISIFRRLQVGQNTPLAKVLPHPSPEEHKRQHKKKHLVPSPNAFLMDVKSPGCYKITMALRRVRTIVLCVDCSTVLHKPTGGNTNLREGCSFRRNQHYMPSQYTRWASFTYICKYV
ncbi:small ribosomal subunit protein eS27-like [Eulemur rufifrons]|uniref:small ribosomal subunit protein eS27-like n=1 Tax=Eulemur rufifrons TaxID=859984 RepID=UPI003743E0F5